MNCTSFNGNGERKDESCEEFSVDRMRVLLHCVNTSFTCLDLDLYFIKVNSYSHFLFTSHLKNFKFHVFPLCTPLMTNPQPRHPWPADLSSHLQVTASTSLSISTLCPIALLVMLLFVILAFFFLPLFSIIKISNIQCTVIRSSSNI